MIICPTSRLLRIADIEFTNVWMTGNGPAAYSPGTPYFHCKRVHEIYLPGQVIQAHIDEGHHAAHQRNVAAEKFLFSVYSCGREKEPSAAAAGIEGAHTITFRVDDTGHNISNWIGGKELPVVPVGNVFLKVIAEGVFQGVPLHP